MKKIFILVCALFLMTSTQAQEIDKSQWSLLVKKTASWCSKCGTYGWSFFKSAHTQFKNENLVIMAAHSSGDLATEVSSAVSNVVPAGSQPKFILDQGLLGVSPSNQSAKLMELGDVIEYNKSAPAFFGVGAQATIDTDGNLNVKNKAQILIENNQNNFFVANYLVRKSVTTFQSGQGSSAQHVNVLETSVSGNKFGNEIKFSAQSVGSEAELEVGQKVDINPDDYILYTVLWLKANDQMVFNNATRTEIKRVNSTEEPSLVDRIELIETTKNHMVFQIDGLTDKKIEVHLYNQIGNRVASSEVLSSTQHRMDYSEVASGIYYLTCTDGVKVFTKTVQIH